MTRRCARCGDASCNVDALDAARGKGNQRRRIDAQRAYVDAQIACEARGKPDWPALLLAAEQRAIVAERLLADSQRRESDLMAFALEIERAVGATAGPGSQDVEGMEYRTRRDAVARVHVLAERCASAERDVEEAGEEMDALTEAIAEHLPTYVTDAAGGDEEECNALETVEYAGDELRALRRESERIRSGLTIEGDDVSAAELWRANVEPLIDRLRLAANGDVGGLSEVIDALIAAAAPRKGGWRDGALSRVGSVYRAGAQVTAPRWDRLGPGHCRARRGPIVCDVHEIDENGWRWEFGCLGRGGCGIAIVLGRSGPRMVDLVPLDEARRACWAAAGEWGAAVVSGREVGRG